MLDPAIPAQLDLARVQAAANAGSMAADSAQADAVREAAIEFEAMFLGQMFAEMWRGIESDPLFGAGQQEQIFRDMMVREMGKSVARAGGVGLADDIAAEMIRIQEGQAP